jgi:hypothetical protein
MTVAICNLHLEYGHCTVKQTHGYVLNNNVKVTKGLGIRWPSLIWPSELRRILAGVMAGTLTITYG